MPTQPLKEILEQANLPWTASNGTIRDRDGRWVADSNSPTPILHSVNNLTRAIEAIKYLQAEASHSVDETSCCYRGCVACKQIKNNPQWKKWHEEGMDDLMTSLETVKTP